MIRKEIKELFEEFYAKYKDYRILFVGHRRADPDAVASAMALSKAFPNSSIAFPDLLPSAKNLIEYVGKEYYLVKNLNLERFDFVVAVDTCSSKMAEGIKEVVACIDHHHKDKHSFNPKYDIAEQTCTSASLLVYKLIKDKVKIDQKLAFALAVAIASDTYRFKAANKEDMRYFYELLELSGKEVKDVYEYANIKYTYEEKIAMLEAMKKVEYVYISGMIIAFTETKRYASEIASILNNIADIAIAFERFNDGYKMSARGSIDIKLNKVMATLGERMQGYGGGHEQAAGAFARGGLKEIKDTIIDIIQGMKNNK